MKKLSILLIALLAQGVNADTKAYAKNELGGKIVLTDEQCASNKSMLRSYKYSGRKHGHQTWEGCWKDDGLTILVKWVDGTQRYEKKDFKVVKNW